MKNFDANVSSNEEFLLWGYDQNIVLFGSSIRYTFRVFEISTIPNMVFESWKSSGLKDILYATIDDPIWEMKYEITMFSKNQLLYIPPLEINL
jgi:hypothetical protein